MSLAVAILAGCDGAVDPEPNPNPGPADVEQIDTTNIALAYEQSCGSCHGDESGDAVSNAMAGALTPAHCTSCVAGFDQLKNVISASMPVEGGGLTPKSCVGKCAEDFANYILNNFEGYDTSGSTTGEGQYQTYCVACHGNPAKGVVGSFPPLNKNTCSACGTATTFINKTGSSMPPANKTACGNDCATKIYDYITKNFPSYQDIVEEAAKNLGSPTGFALNGNTLSWNALATAPDYWIIDGWDAKDAVWASVARPTSASTSHTVSGTSYGKYRLYAVTDQIASVPSITSSPGISISTDGADTWGAADRAHFSYVAVTGDVTAEATIESISVSAGVTLAKVGVMLREDLTAGSRQAFISMTSGIGIRGLSRDTAGANVTIKGNDTAITAFPVQVRLARAGNTITLSARSGTNPYKVINTFDLAFNAGYIGVAAAKANSTTNVETQLSSFTVNGAAAGNLTPIDFAATSTVTVGTGSAETDSSTVGVNPYVEKASLTLLNRYEYSNLLNDQFANLNLPFNDLAGGDKSSGFEVVVNASDLDVNEYTNAAEQFSAKAVAGVQCNNKDCALNKAREIAPAMIRQPISESFVGVLGGIYDEVSRRLDGTAALQSVYEAVATSPSFLYRVETAGLGMDAGTVVPVTGYEMASRLSFTLWASGPDEALLQAAASGALTTPAQIKKQAERMVDDPRAKQGFASFYRQWFELESLVEKEREADGLVMDDALREAMIDASDAFVNKVVFDDNGSVDDFFTAPFVGNNSKIQALTGINSGSAASQVVSTAGSTRSGILGQPAVLSRHAEHHRTSIASRGSFVNIELLCKPFGPPPDNIPVFDDIVADGKSARVLFDELTLGDPACSSCHQYINPMGSALEAFDHFGRHRTVDSGYGNLAIDTQSDILSRATGMRDKSVDGLAEFNQYLASLDSVKSCFARKYLTYAIRRQPSLDENASLEQLVKKITDQRLSIKQLLIETTQTPVFLYRQQ